MVSKSFEKKLEAEFVKRGITGSSLKSYMSYMRTIIDKLSPKTRSFVFLKNTDTVLKFINSHYKDGARTAVGAIVRLITNRRGYVIALKEYKKSLDSKIKIHNLDKKLNKVPDKLVGIVGKYNWNSLGDKIVKDLKTKLDSALKGTDFKKQFSLYELFVLSLFIFRAGFLERLSYASFLLKKNTGNYIIKSSGKMFFNKFKNVDKIGKQPQVLPKAVLKELNKYLKFKKNTTHLFYNEKFRTENKKKPYTNKEFAKLVQRISKEVGLESVLSMNDYRKLFETHLQSTPEYQNLNTIEKEQLHIRKAFHKKGVAETTYKMVRKMEVEDVTEED